jgi:hypothetical protein
MLEMYEEECEYGMYDFPIFLLLLIGELFR